MQGLYQTSPTQPSKECEIPSTVLSKTSNITFLHCPQSQSIFRRYESNLPISLIYILLVDQRLLTLETWCGYGTILNGLSIALGFSLIVANAPPARKLSCSSRLRAISLDNPIPWLLAVKKKRKLFQGYAPMSPRLFVLPHRIHCKLEEY